MKNNCSCPYIPCKLRGNCAACIAKNRREGTLTNCMEDIAMSMGAILPLRQPCTSVVKNPEAVAQATAYEIITCLKNKPDALLCLPAGETFVLTSKYLVERKIAGDIDFSKARFVALDEWLDLDNSQENCEAFLRRHLYDPLEIPDEHIRLFNVIDDVEQACQQMDEYLEAEGPIDLMILGIGMNGHLGLNEPGVSWDQGSIVVNLDPSTQEVGQKYFSSHTSLTRGITLGMRHIFAARRVVLQAQGKAKSSIVARMYSSQPNIDLPASVMVLLSNSIVVLDEEAASLIQWAE